MRIAFVGGYSVPNLGGIENYVFNLARQLNRLGWETIIICRGPKSEEKIVEGVRIIQKKALGVNSLSYLWHFIFASLYVSRSKDKIDVINYQYFFLSPLYYWLPKLKRIKIFTTIHSFPVDSPKHSRMESWFLRIEWKISRNYLGKVISVSDTVSELVQHRLGKPSRIVRGGVDLPSPDGGADGGYYLYLGRIDPVKGLETLIDAFLMRDPDRPEKLVIVGDFSSSYGISLMKRARGDDRILFPGPAFGGDKIKWFSNCKAFVLPSYSEGFPISLLEAMSYSKPCLASKINANVEVLTDELGLWFTPGDALSLSDAMKRIEDGSVDIIGLSSRVRTRVENNFTWKKSAEKFKEIINE